MDRQKTVRALALVLLLGVTLRGLAVWRFAGQLDADVDQYRAIAGHLAHGEGYLSPDGRPTAYRPPLYPLLLAGILAAGGGSLSIGVAQVLLGGATIWLTLSLGARLGLGNARFVAGALVALDPLLIYNTALVMTESLATFLSVLLLWWIAGATRITSDEPESAAAQIHSTATAPNGRSWCRPIVSGALLGLCCLCRPTFWAFGGCLIAGELCWRLWIRRSNWATTSASNTRSLCVLAQELALLLAGAAGVVAPWGLRNLCVLGSPIITTTHGGYTLLLGHNPVYDRDVLQVGGPAVWKEQSLRDWQSSLEDRMQDELPDPRDELARDRWMYREAWHNIDNDPGLVLRSGVSLLGRLWGLVPGNVSALSAEGNGGESKGRIGHVLKWGIGSFYLFTFSALCAGMFRLRPSTWRRWWPLAALLLGFTAVHALYWSDMRMRAPLMPAIALFAARGLMRSKDE